MTWTKAQRTERQPAPVRVCKEADGWAVYHTVFRVFVSLDYETAYTVALRKGDRLRQEAEEAERLRRVAEARAERIRREEDRTAFLYQRRPAR